MLFGTYLGSTQGQSPVSETPPSPSQQSITPENNFDGRTVWAGWLSPVVNQGSCGSCYAYASNGVLEDRYALLTNGAVRPRFNPLEALICHPVDLTLAEHVRLQFDTAFQSLSETKTQVSACKGGTLADIARYYYRYGAVEDSCIPYTPVDSYITKARRLPLCSTIQKACTLPGKVPRMWPLADFYVTSNSEDYWHIAEAMKKDLRHNGPLLAGFRLYESFRSVYDGVAVYEPLPNEEPIGAHAIRITGFGVLDGKPYWQCVNSWGVDWGRDGGYFKLPMADRRILIEQNHLGFIPQIPGVFGRFAIVPHLSETRDIDNRIRADTGVNPFTLMSAETTTLALQLDLPLVRVFDRLQYDVHPSLVSQADDLGQQVMLWISVAVIIILLASFIPLLVSKKQHS
jgi:hypothetical protein